MLTGVGCYRYFQQKIGKPYSAFIDTTKATSLFLETVYRITEQKWESLAGQKAFDELSVLLKSNKIFTPVNNRVSVAPAIIDTIGNTAGLNPTISVVTVTPHHMKVGDPITVSGATGLTYTLGNINGTFTVVTAVDDTHLTYVATGANISGGAYVFRSGIAYTATATILDYLHLEASRAKFLDPLTPVITGISIAADGIITTDVRHNLREGDNITIAAVTGTAPLTTNMNAAQTVTAIVNSTQFKVGKSTVGGTYTSGGTISRTYYNWCVQYPSLNKIAKFGKPSLTDPRVEFVENSLLFYADENLVKVCTEVKIDYMSKPLIEPDMANAVIDLEWYWSKKLLYLILDEAALNFAGQYNNPRLQQTEVMAIRDNK